MSTSPPLTTPTAPQIRANVTEQTGIHWSTIYLHTVPGTLKCVCLVCIMYNTVSIFRKLLFEIYVNFFSIFFKYFPKQIFTLLGFICCTLSAYGGYGRAQFFNICAATAFWFTGILLILYLFHAVYVFYKIPWIKIEFFFCAGATLALMLASSLLAAKGGGWLIAAAVNCNI